MEGIDSPAGRVQAWRAMDELKSYSYTVQPGPPQRTVIVALPKRKRLSADSPDRGHILRGISGGASGTVPRGAKVLHGRHVDRSAQRRYIICGAMNPPSKNAWIIALNCFAVVLLWVVLFPYVAIVPVGFFALATTFLTWKLLR